MEPCNFRNTVGWFVVFTLVSEIDTVFLLINAPGAMQSIDKEPLFCIQFAKQRVCPVVSAVQVF